MVTICCSGGDAWARNIGARQGAVLSLGSLRRGRLSFRPYVNVMKTCTAFLLVALVLILAAPSRGESPYERDLKKLIEMRDKAIAEAVDPIITRFNVEAEQLLMKATQSPDADPNVADKIKAMLKGRAIGEAAPSITDLEKQLVGTTWKAEPNQPLRGGLGDQLHFTEKTVEPKGYRYIIDSRTVIIHFNHGDKQEMILSADGRRLKFIHFEKEYSYELTTAPQ